MTGYFKAVLGLLAIGFLAAAQNSSPEYKPLTGAELRDLLKKSVEEDNLNFEPSRNYVYIEDRDTRLLDAKGGVTKSNTETHEIMVLYGERYERLIRKDGKPLSPNQERAERDKLDRETNKRKRESADAKAKRLETERKKSAACGADFVDGFQFHLLGVEDIGGRPAWKVEAEPLPRGLPNCSAMKKAKLFHLCIWIDRADTKWAKVEAGNVAPVTFGAILIRAPAGALHVGFELTRRDDGVWLPAQVRARIDVKFMLLKTFRVEIVSTFSDYRKFQSESRIVE